MSDFWRQCEGQVIDNRLRLRHYLGGTDDFRGIHDTAPRTAISESGYQVHSCWPQRRGPNLSLASHYAARSSESPAHIRRRPLPPRKQGSTLCRNGVCRRRPLPNYSAARSCSSEAREMLEPMLDALVYLHSNGLAHSRIKPSNISPLRGTSSNFPATRSPPSANPANHRTSSTLTTLRNRNLSAFRSRRCLVTRRDSGRNTHAAYARYAARKPSRSGRSRYPSATLA